MGWANRITVARAFLTFGLWGLLAVASPAPSTQVWWIAWALFVVTAVTDALDGIVARRLGEVSVFGRIADPLVDKLLVLGTMTVLLGVDGIEAVLPAWAVALMTARELMVTALRGVVEGKGISFQAMPLGKAKMILQSLAVGCVLLHGADFWIVRDWHLAIILVLGATVLTVISGVDYALRAWAILRKA